MTGVNHVGFTVSNLDRSIEFYRLLFRRDPVMREVVGGQFPADVIGYDPIELELAFFELPGGSVSLELIEYREPSSGHVSMETFNVGNGHLCLLVDDLDAEYGRLQASGVDFRHDHPVDIAAGLGPYSGGKVVYLRDPDGISVELLQLPSNGSESGESAARDISVADVE